VSLGAAARTVSGTLMRCVHMSAFCALPRRAGGVRQAVAAAPWRRCSCHDTQLPR